MKLRLTLFTLCLGAIALPYSANAQQHQDCFMLDEKGSYINLWWVCHGKLPGATPPQQEKAKTTGIEPPQGTETETSGVFEVPIQRRQSNIPVVKVTINGNKTVEMMVDTGATLTIVPEKVAKELGVEQQLTLPVTTPGKKNVSMPVGQVKSIKVGGAVANNLKVGMSSSLPIGLLGQNFYSKYNVVIKKEVVEFRKRDSQSK